MQANMKRSSHDADHDESRLQTAGLGDAGLVAGSKRKATDSDKKPKAAKRGKIHDPHRKPKNFAERLMRVLQNEIGTDTIWWIGEGKAIAIHSRNLRRGNMLSEHFNVKDYSVFIRNCNRWGFRRTVSYKVPQGVITYECSLFRRDEPHLVHHMRMDSDVQDVFVKHRDLEGDAPFDPKRIAKAAKAAAAEGSKVSKPEVGSPKQETTPSPFVGLAPNPVCQPVAPGGVNALQGFSREALQLIQGTHLAGLGLARDPPTLQAPAPALSAAIDSARMSQLLSGGLAQLQQPSRPTHAPAQDPLLQRILGLSQEYLNTPSQALHSTNDPMTMALQILKLQADKYNNELEQKKLTSNRDPLAALRNQLLASTNKTPAPAASDSAQQVLQADHLFRSASLTGQQESAGVLQQLLATHGVALGATTTTRQPDIAADPNAALAKFLGQLQNKSS